MYIQNLSQLKSLRVSSGLSTHPESYAGRGHALVKHPGHSPPSNIFLVLLKDTFLRDDGGLMALDSGKGKPLVCLPYTS